MENIAAEIVEVKAAIFTVEQKLKDTSLSPEDIAYLRQEKLALRQEKHDLRQKEIALLNAQSSGECMCH